MSLGVCFGREYFERLCVCRDGLIQSSQHLASGSKVHLGSSPLEGSSFSRLLFECRPISQDRPFHPIRVALALTQDRERKGEVVLRRSPIERNAVTCPLLERSRVRLDSLLQAFNSVLALSQNSQCIA